MSVYEDVRRVVLQLDASEAIEIWSPIRVWPVRQVEVAIVHVARARDMGTHRRVDFGHVCQPLRRIGRARPAGIILNAEC